MKLADLPVAIQKQVLPGLRKAHATLTPEQRRKNGKKAWQTRLDRAREKAKELEKEGE